MYSVASCDVASARTRSDSSLAKRRPHARTGKAGRASRREVGRQLECRQVGEPLAPERQPLVEPLALQRRALPRREVAELQRHRRQPVRDTSRLGGVERVQLAHQHTVRPCVRHDVMRQQQKHVIVAGNTRQRDAESRLAREVERRVRHLAQPGDRLLLARVRRQRAHVVHRDRNGRRRQHHLHRAVAARREHGAQSLVTRDECGDRPLERRHVERAANASCNRRVVRRQPGRRTIQQPEDFLREGQWRFGALGARDDRRLRRRALQPLFLEQLRQETPPLFRQLVHLHRPSFHSLPPSVAPPVPLRSGAALRPTSPRSAARAARRARRVPPYAPAQ